jgi:hypothetical protein
VKRQASRIMFPRAARSSFLAPLRAQKENLLLGDLAFHVFIGQNLL